MPLPDHPFGREPAIPHFARRGTFVPTKGGSLTVQLSGEQNRAEVLSVHGRDVAVVRLGGPLLPNVGHNFKPRDVITVQRNISVMGIEEWVPVDERKLHELENAERLARVITGEDAEPVFSSDDDQDG